VRRGNRTLSASSYASPTDTARHGRSPCCTVVHWASSRTTCVQDGCLLSRVRNPRVARNALHHPRAGQSPALNESLNPGERDSGRVVQRPAQPDHVPGLNEKYDAGPLTSAHQHSVNSHFIALLRTSHEWARKPKLPCPNVNRCHSLTALSRSVQWRVTRVVTGGAPAAPSRSLRDRCHAWSPADIRESAGR